MPNLKWLLLVIFATVVAGRRNIRPERELKKVRNVTLCDLCPLLGGVFAGCRFSCVILTIASCER